MSQTLNRVGYAFGFLLTGGLIAYKVSQSREPNAGTALVVILYTVPIIALLTVLFVVGKYISLSIQAYQAQIEISPFRLMRLNRAGIDPIELVHSAIRLHMSHLDTPISEIESEMKMGRDIRLITTAMIATKSTSDPLTFDRACGMDRKGQLDEYLKNAGLLLSEDPNLHAQT